MSTSTSTDAHLVHVTAPTTAVDAEGERLAHPTHVELAIDHETELGRALALGETGDDAAAVVHLTREQALALADELVRAAA